MGASGARAALFPVSFSRDGVRTLQERCNLKRRAWIF